MCRRALRMTSGYSLDSREEKFFRHSFKQSLTPAFTLHSFSGTPSLGSDLTGRLPRAVRTTETAGQGAECHQCFIYMRHHCFYKLDYGCKWNTQAISTDTREVSISGKGRFCKSNWLILEKKGGRANSWQCMRQGPQDSERSTIVVALRG